MLFFLFLAGMLAIIVTSWIRTIRRRRAWELGHNEYSYKPALEPAIWITVMTVIFGPCVISLVFLLLTVGGLGVPQFERSGDLAALRTGSTVQGQFFLGSGTIDNKQVISYLERTPDGGVVLASVDARKARIYEDEDQRPHFDIYCSAIDNPWLAPAKFSTGIFCGYYFHVPAGSVLQSYEVTP